MKDVFFPISLSEKMYILLPQKIAFTNGFYVLPLNQMLQIIIILNAVFLRLDNIFHIRLYLFVITFNILLYDVVFIGKRNYFGDFFGKLSFRKQHKHCPQRFRSEKSSVRYVHQNYPTSPPQTFPA